MTLLKDGAAATFNDCANEMFVILADRAVQNGASPDNYQADAGRDLALAKTHLEDALTRYNSARYRMGGTWKRADPDKEDS